MYRTSPLKGAWQHAPYFHDGSAATLVDVGNAYNTKRGLGLTAMRLGSWDEALAGLRRAVELAPKSVEYLRYLAEAAAVRELYHEVEACCQRMLELDPGQAVAQNALGWLAHEGGRYAEARQRYQSAIRLQPDLGRFA